MAENKKSFILYADLINSIDHLTNEEKGILFNHILEYVNDKNPVMEDRVLLSAWKPIQSQMKRDLIKFEEVKEKRSKAGKRSAELRSLANVEQNATNSTSVESVEQCSTNPTDNDTVNVNENVNDNVNVILLEKETKGEILNSQKSDDKIPVPEERKKVAPKKEINLPFPTPEFKASWDLWKAYRKKKDKFQYFDEESEQKALTELFNLSKQNQATALAIIRQSIDKGWKGFFELKTTFTNGSTQSTLSQARRR